MRRQTLLLLTTMLGVALVVLLTACGGGSTASGDGGSSTSGGAPYDVSASMASLQGAGWEATETEGIPDTYTGVQQVGYLETTAPDGEPIDLQFFENAEDAQSELDETKKQEEPFEGTTVGNVMVFDPEADTAAVTPENLEAVKGLLM